MNNDERVQLTQFLEQLIQARAMAPDSEADALIRAACTRQPDAAYLLVQRALLLQQGIQNAQNEIARLQDQLAQSRNQSPQGTGSSFIDANAWGNSPRPPQPPTANWAPAPAPPVAPMPASSMPAPSAWGSGMLGSIATTAAGVVAGGFLFQGIEQLLGHRGAHPGPSDGLASQSAAADTLADGGNNLASEPTSTGLFDTSSVDDYIANDDGDL